MRQLSCALPPNGLIIDQINSDIKFFKQMSKRFLVKDYKSVTPGRIPLLFKAYPNDFEGDGDDFDATEDVEDGDL